MERKRAFVTDVLGAEACFDSRSDWELAVSELVGSRGIDVALLHREDLYVPDTAYPVRVRFTDAPDEKTRDILYACGTLAGVPLHLFVNHWPSRYGGYEATRPLRRQAARVLRAAVDSLFAVDPSAYIIAMGDFNDGPGDETMRQYLDAATEFSDLTLFTQRIT